MGSAIREAWAAASALAAYLTTVLPRARRELRRLGPLPAEKKRNAEAVAVFATLAPRRHRAAVVRAIISLQAAIDLRDEAEEASGAEAPLLVGRVAALEADWHLVVRTTLPAHEAVLPVLRPAVERCKEAQRRTHLAAREGRDPLRRWAMELETSRLYRWWEVAAGASSSVAAHALTAAAADPATSFARAGMIDGAYQPSIGALTVFLDDLVDREEDRAAGEHNYLAYYEDSGEAAERLALLARHADVLLARVPHSERHRAILAGVAAYYLSSPAAQTAYAEPVRERLLASLGSGARLLAGFMRVRRLGERKWPGQAGNSPEP
ncbi:MAG TPA: DUF2600 family protein [Solirubrobacterales bacterium]|nr:DUF2600 family protein [Solirubrobacterales bacterium]